MKRILVIIPIIVLASTFIYLVSLDKQYFICSIEYKSDILVRNDNRGDGLFASSRSGRRIHKGIDLMADMGEVVLAAKNG